MPLQNDINYWFDFNDQDIIANRQGYMTPRQLDNLEVDETLGWYHDIFIGTVVLFILIHILIGRTSTLEMQLVVLFGIILALKIINIILMRNRSTQKPKKDNPLLTIQGQVRLYSQPRFQRGGGTIYRVRIDNRLTFHVRYQQWKSLEDGAHYILYYSLHSFRIMSLEKISEVGG